MLRGYITQPSKPDKRQPTVIYDVGSNGFMIIFYCYFTEVPRAEEKPDNNGGQRQPSENSLVFQQATNDNRGEDSMPVALMILIPILSSGLILLILAVVCIRR